MSNKRLLNQFNTLNNDKDRWDWVKNNQDSGIIIMLDNDDTFGVITNNNVDYIFQFDDYLGYSDGILSLLESFGINAEYV